MAKDRITFTKQRRESEKKRKAEEKRADRARRKQNPSEQCESRNSPAALSPAPFSPAELLVLGIFRKFLMTPGKMLCFRSSELESYHLPLANLTDKGMLVVEKSHGGYSLTMDGFHAMKDST